MGTVVKLWDGLRNALTGTGTRRDVRTANHYAARVLTQQEIAAAYSGSGLIKKIVSIPALDMVREWRDPSGLDDDQAAKLFDEEKRLAIRQKIIAAEKLRGMGGGALILGLPGLPSQPAPAGSTGSLAFVHVVSRWHLTFDQLEDDFTRDSFGEPAMWRMSTTGGQQDIHPSRVIPFRADTTASLAMPSVNGADAFWGESEVQKVLDAVQDSDMARAAFAALLNKARTLRVGVRGLYEMIAAGQESVVNERLAIMAAAESIHNAIIFDAGNEEGKGGELIQDAQYKFEGAKDIINALNEFVAAISDIPATRLLGRAPEGMNASGDSQQADWQKLVRARQTLDLAPCLDRLDRYLVPSALGSTPATYAYDFAPLGTESDKDRANRFKTEAEAVQIVANMGIVPERALARGTQSWMVAEGYLPELEAALAEIPDEERYGLEPDDIDEVEEGGDPDLAGESGSIGSEPLRRAANDAAPRPLYVRRDLLNGADLVKWAKANGFETTLPADDMHVTVLYSRTAVDPMVMGESWGNQEDGGLVVTAGGPRALEKFGEGAVVLQFASWGLISRHKDMIERGASHDYPEYLPHVTLTYSAPEGLDIASIVPFAGELRFGPEIFEPLDLDWKSKIEEA